MSNWNERDHPRDEAGKFTSKDMTPLERVISSPETQATIARLRAKNPERYPLEPVKIDLDASIQKQFDSVDKYERQAIAERYIKDNLRRNDYVMTDKRVVQVTGKTASKYSHSLDDIKIQTTPHLKELIERSEFVEEVGIHDYKQGRKDFTEFAYYRAKFEISGEKYVGRLVVGIHSVKKYATVYDMVDIKPMQ
jgi:hypothetical protein